jgi:hypothetical protein
VLGTAAMLLAVAAHVAGGGSTPSAATLALLAVPVAWVAALVCRRPRRTSLPTFAALAGTQVLLHEALMVLSGPSCATANTPSMLGMPGSHAAVGALTCAAPHATAMAGMGAATMAPGGVMLAAHALATVLTAALLARGEHLLWSLVDLLRVLLPTTRVTHIGLATATADLVRAAATPTPTTRQLASVLTRRGPPATVLTPLGAA